MALCIDNLSWSIQFKGELKIDGERVKVKETTHLNPNRKKASETILTERERPVKEKQRQGEVNLYNISQESTTQ